MSKNFWQKLKKPILALAPMAGITDGPFRRLCKKYGAQVVYSEMASVAALCYGSGETLELLKFDKSERPYVVQLFGSDPAQFAEATKIIVKKIKPDGIDINFGCPVKKVIKQGAGSALFKDLEKSRAVIEAVLANTNLPVSIKVRTEVGKIKLDKFLQNISDLEISALMIHGRTFKQGFGGEIDVEAIKDARKYLKGIILANGGINSHEEINKVLELTGADGVGIARGAYGNPWIFSSAKPDKAEIFKVAYNHAKMMVKEKGDGGIMEMRKHLCWYMNGLDGAKKYREKLVTVKTLAEIKNCLK
jgi:tRNA-dihydrouridine synthase B